MNPTMIRCLIVFSLLLSGCKKASDQPPKKHDEGSQSTSLPDVVTGKVTSTSDTSALCVFTVTDHGNSQLLAVGICWDTIPQPTINKRHTNEKVGTGTFSTTLTGIVSTKKYYVRAYATNSDGTSYGKEIEFEPLKWIQTGFSFFSFFALEDKAGLFIGTNDGLLFSNDSGATIYNKMLKYHAIYSLVRSGNRLLACASSGLYRSDDDGNSWSLVNNKLPFSVLPFDLVKIKNTLMTLSDSSILISNDGGETWKRSINGLPNAQLYENFIPTRSIVSNLATTDNFAFCWVLESSTSNNILLKRYDISDDKWVSTGITAGRLDYLGYLHANGPRLFLNINGKVFTMHENSNILSLQESPVDFGLTFRSVNSIVVLTDFKQFFNLSIDGGISWKRKFIPIVKKTSWYALSSKYLWMTNSTGIVKLPLKDI